MLENFAFSQTSGLVYYETGDGHVWDVFDSQVLGIYLLNYCCCYYYVSLFLFRVYDKFNNISRFEGV